MSFQVEPLSVLISTTPPSMAIVLPLTSTAVSNQWRWLKLMRSGRVRDTASSGDVSDASAELRRSLACHACCSGVSSTTLQREMFDGVHEVPRDSKSSNALCFCSSCALRRNGALNAAAPATKSGSVTETATVGLMVETFGVSETFTLALTVWPGSLG